MSDNSDPKDFHDIKDECLETADDENQESTEAEEDYSHFRSECFEFAKSVAKTIVITAAATSTSLLVTLVFKKFLGK